MIQYLWAQPNRRQLEKTLRVQAKQEEGLRRFAETILDNKQYNQLYAS